MTRSAVVACVVLAAGAVLGAQQPTFRVRVDAIEIDAFVTDAQGNPVKGLTVDDFQILEDGKPQVIASFSQVDIPFEPRTESLDAKAAVDPDVVSNVRSDGRAYLFMLDEVSAASALRARVFLRRFLQQHFAANDRGAPSCFSDTRTRAPRSRSPVIHACCSRRSIASRAASQWRTVRIKY